MKISRIFIGLLILTNCLVVVSAQPAAKTATYQQMSQPERAAFISEQARRIGRQISGRDYQFTASFVAEIQKALDFYVRRIGDNRSDKLGKSDARLVFERGQTQAPTLNGIFKARGVSPLIGLYIPLIEAEYVNLTSPNPSGSVGMFQFLPKTGEHFGLSAADLLDVPKSADA